MFPLESETLTLTTVVPIGKELPETGLTEGGMLLVEASRAVTENETGALLPAVRTVMSDGTVITGGEAPPRV
jgi:hypothetical protein